MHAEQMMIAETLIVVYGDAATINQMLQGEPVVTPC